MLMKKKEIQKALLLASKKEIQVQLAPTLEFVRSGAHDVTFRWNLLAHYRIRERVKL